jgi:hypothetical protein
VVSCVYQSDELSGNDLLISRTVRRGAAATYQHLRERSRGAPEETIGDRARGADCVNGVVICFDFLNVADQAVGVAAEGAATVRVHARDPQQTAAPLHAAVVPHVPPPVHSSDGREGNHRDRQLQLEGVVQGPPEQQPR